MVEEQKGGFEPGLAASDGRQIFDPDNRLPD